MTTDARTTNRNYPKPHADNTLSVDITRLIQALEAIGVDVAGLLTDVAGRALATHAHAIEDVTGLQAALNAKRDASWVPSLDDLSDVNTSGAANGQFLRLISGFWQPATISVAFSDISGKPSSYPTTWSDVTNKPTTFSPSTHAHATSDITGLDAALAGRLLTTGGVLTGTLRATRFGTNRTPVYDVDAYLTGTGNATVAAANDSVVAVMQASGSVQANIGTITSHPLSVLVGNVERVRFSLTDTTLNNPVSISMGSSSSIAFQTYGTGSQFMQLVCQAANGAQLQFGAQVNDAYIGTITDTPIRLIQQGVARARLNGAGLTITQNMGLFFENASGTYTNGTAGVRILPFGGHLYIENYEAGSIIFGRAGYAESMRLGPAGQLGIGPSANYGTAGQVPSSNGPSAAFSWADIGALMAGVSLGALGQFGFFTNSSTGAPGSTWAGSSLTYSNSNNGAGGGSPSGTWRAHGNISLSGTSTLYQRIA